ncbi:MAG: AAA family ATPase [Cyanobacteria bacterium SBLK]|nr:AAA family ATPase [Cyanobacteria bacterium SBLK]
MLKSLKIENFRRFKSFELEDLGRINLLVGMNNSGKTSILEAIQLLRSRTHVDVIRQSTIERGEYYAVENRSGNIKDIVFNICSLFFGHEIHLDTQCSISAKNHNQHDERVIMSSSEKNTTIPISSNEQSSLEHLQELQFKIEWIWEQGSKFWEADLFSDGTISDRQTTLKSPGDDILKDLQYRDRLNLTQFVSLSSLTGEEMGKLFDSISLMPEESFIYEALQTIEPKIERIVTVGENVKIGSRGGFFARLSDSDRRIPLGSLGDGIWRMLGLTLALINAKGGILLVDEIDTGLHFTALSNMWKLIWKMSKKLDVQVFATTHSSDCWQSLASIASLEETEQDGITIQRIEKDKQKAVIFPRKGIVIAAEDEIEVR